MREFFFRVAEGALPLLAVELARDGIPPEEVWQVLRVGFAVHLTAAGEILQIPDDVPLPFDGFLLKLYYLTDESKPAVQAELSAWLRKEVQKGEGEDLDLSIWE